MANLAPGPWRVSSKCDQAVWDADGNVIAKMYAYYHTDAIRRAHACAISALPELLAAADLALEVLTELARDDDGTPSIQAKFDLQAAIDKARGKQ